MDDELEEDEYERYERYASDGPDAPPSSVLRLTVGPAAGAVPGPGRWRAALPHQAAGCTAAEKLAPGTAPLCPTMADHCLPPATSPTRPLPPPHTCLDPPSVPSLPRLLPQGLPDDASEAELRQMFEPVGGLRQIRLPRSRATGLCKGFAFMVRRGRFKGSGLLGWGGCLQELPGSAARGRHTPSCNCCCSCSCHSPRHTYNHTHTCQLAACHPHTRTHAHAGNPPKTHPLKTTLPPLPLPCCPQEFEDSEAAAALMQSDWRQQTFFGQHRLGFEYARRVGWRDGEGGGGGGGRHAADWACEYCQGINFGR